MKTWGLMVLAILALSAQAHAQQPAGPAPQRGSEGAGATIFGNVCGACHGKLKEAMSPEMLRQLPAEKIYQTITTGSHAAARLAKAALTDDEKVAIAEWVSGRTLGAPESGDARTMANGCPSHPPLEDLSGPSWNGWSPDMTRNTRYQSARAAGPVGPRESGSRDESRRHGFAPAAVARLELKWAFGLPAASSAYGQPTVVGGRVFIGSDSAYLYSLDAATGCVHWAFQARAGLRSTPMIGPAGPLSTRLAAFFGDVRGNVYAVDASSGKQMADASGSASALPHHRRGHCP